ncbi:decapping endonuclease targeting mRNA, partial [Nowakowskiella sp. JEL0407]
MNDNSDTNIPESTGKRKASDPPETQPTSTAPTKSPKLTPHNFPIHPIQRFQSTKALYQQPSEIAYFSFTSSRELKLDSRETLKYYCPPNLKDVRDCNLNIGYPEKFVKKGGGEGVEALLKCLKNENEKLAAGGGSLVMPKICTWRGLITKIFVTPYSKGNDWELQAIKIKDTIYIIEKETPEKQEYGTTDQHRRFTYYGYKFESLSTISKPAINLQANDPEIISRRDDIVNTNEQFCSVFRTKIGDVDMVLGAEVDCTLSSDKNIGSQQKHYVELKTNRVLTNAKGRESFE